MLPLQSSFQSATPTPTIATTSSHTISPNLHSRLIPLPSSKQSPLECVPRLRLKGVNATLRLVCATARTDLRWRTSSGCCSRVCGHQGEERAMDWDDVTLDDLVDALKEVDWSIPPRPLGEFFGKFSVPRNDSKWEARFRCNLFYYRTNYVILVGSVFVLAFVRNPLALGAVSLAGLSVACLNDSFAITLSNKLTRAVNQISPPLGRRLQTPRGQAPVTRKPQGRPRKRTVYICGQDRRFCVAALASVGALLCWRSSAIVTVCGASIIALTLPMLHASFRTPNMKSRLNTLQEDIRAALKGY